MTIQETTYRRVGNNDMGEVVGTRDLHPGDSVALEEIRTNNIDVLLMPQGDIFVGRNLLPPTVRTLHVLTRHPQTGQDRASITPDGRVLKGSEIDFVVPSTEPGLTRRITSTSNPAPMSSTARRLV